MKIVTTLVMFVCAAIFLCDGIFSNYEKGGKKLRIVFAAVFFIAAVAVNIVIINSPGYVTVKISGRKYEVVEKPVDFKIPFLQNTVKIRCRQKDKKFSSLFALNTEYSATVTYEVNSNDAAWIAENLPDVLYYDSITENVIDNDMVASAIENCTDKENLEQSVTADLQDTLDRKYKEGVFIIKNVEINTKRNLR